MPFARPGHGTEPLCGWEWLKKHREDHTQEEMAKLTIVTTVDGKTATLRLGSRKGSVKTWVGLQKKGG